MKMAAGVILALAVVGWFLSGCASSAKRPLPTASSVDLQRYAGVWHEIARLPNRFQRDDADATAEYRIQGDGSVKVLNTEYRSDGTKDTIEGRATAVPGSHNSRLRVKFSGLAALVPAPESGNYWIIQVEPDYSVALVGTPDRKFLWILARRPKIDSAKLHRYLMRAHDLGFDTAKMRFATSQAR